MPAPALLLCYTLLRSTVKRCCLSEFALHPANHPQPQDLKKALRTATNAAGAFFTVPCWMTAVTPPPLRPLLEQWALYLSQIQSVGYEVVDLILVQVRKEYSAATLSSAACTREGV